MPVVGDVDEIGELGLAGSVEARPSAGRLVDVEAVVAVAEDEASARLVVCSCASEAEIFAMDSSDAGVVAEAVKRLWGRGFVVAAGCGSSCSSAEPTSSCISAS